MNEVIRWETRAKSSRHLRPGGGGKAFHHIIGKLFGWEVAVLEQGARLNFDIANGTELFHESTEGMERAYRLHGEHALDISKDKCKAPTYVTLDARDEKLVYIVLRVLHEVRWCLFCRNRNQGDTLVCGLEPDDLGPLDDGTLVVISTITFTLAAFSFLLLLRRSGRRTEQTKSSGEQLTRHALNNGDDMPSKLRLDFVGYPDQRKNVSDNHD